MSWGVECGWAVSVSWGPWQDSKCEFSCHQNCNKPAERTREGGRTCHRTLLLLPLFGTGRKCLPPASYFRVRGSRLCSL
ncbi:uncharacterized protein Dana_GF27366 [Drosophila ananassae]|uniref:Uncharacterized protein n=1 Tax=Drosophila ananassae TaxID=7217 RepID=A0A0P9A938_DROAN|nr:uncharacterized protein Dana_GF27366 [Drosophila ananassae]